MDKVIYQEYNNNLWVFSIEPNIYGNIHLQKTNEEIIKYLDGQAGRNYLFLFCETSSNKLNQFSVINVYHALRERFNIITTAMNFSDWLELVDKHNLH